MANVSITGYTLNCTGISEAIDVDQSTTVAVVDGLMPFTNYSCQIFARVNGNIGDVATINQQTAEERKLFIASFHIMICTTLITTNLQSYSWLSRAFCLLPTLVGPGSAPINISVSNKTSEYLEITWSSPVMKYGNVLFYTLSINFTNGTKTTKNTTSDSRYFSISRLEPYQLVAVQISATNSAGEGPYSQPPFRDRTSESSKTYYKNLSAHSITISILP